MVNVRGLLFLYDCGYASVGLCKRKPHKLHLHPSCNGRLDDRHGDEQAEKLARQASRTPRMFMICLPDMFVHDPENVRNLSCERCEFDQMYISRARESATGPEKYTAFQEEAMFRELFYSTLLYYSTLRY